MATSSDLHDRAQDVKRCQLCPGKYRKSAAETVCNTCHVDLCKDCVGHHMISSPTIRHDVVTYEFQKSEIIPPQCSVHPEKRSEMFCVQCDSPICLKCLACGSHANHNVPYITEIYSSKQDIIRKYLIELQTSILPVYDSILTEIESMSSSIVQKHGERQQRIDELNKACHYVVDNVFKKYREDSKQMEREDIDSIQSLKSVFQKQISFIQSSMTERKSILASNDAFKLVHYTSNNENFRSIPPRFELTVPPFKCIEFTEQALCHIIGDIPATMKTSIQGKALKAPQPVFRPKKPIREFLDLPFVVGNIYTEKNISKVACFPTTDQIYISGSHEIIQHMTTEGKVLENIETKRLSCPVDLTVTRNGYLAFAGHDRSINIVKSGTFKVECLLRIQGWIPGAICSTLTDELLVHMTTPYRLKRPMQRKVVRYSGSTVKQEIQLSAISSNSFPSYLLFIDENKNFDIVVSDTNSVIVLSNKGQFRFSYDKNSQSKKYRNFFPCGLTTDNMCHILIADSGNNIIHIIDQNGQFLL